MDSEMDDIAVVESPQIIKRFSFDKSLAQRMFVEFSKKSRNVFLESIYDGGDLYRNGNKFFILDKNQNMVTYYMQFNERKVFGKIATYQSLVWRDVDSPETKLVAINVFFKYLFPIRNLVVTDRQQTDRGGLLWHSIVGQALKIGIHAYFVDLNTKKILPLKSGYDLDTFADDIWGIPEKYQARLLVLSKEPFHGRMSEILDSFGIPIIE